MKVLEASRLGSIVESMCLEISTTLPEDVASALASFRERESSDRGRKVIEMILENAALAAGKKVPICQDTGVFSVYVSLGRDTAVQGDLDAEVEKAVSCASKTGCLRSSIVSLPASSRVNTGDNTPPVIKVEISGGESSTISVIAKGGGSENASRLVMLHPGAGWEGVIDFAVKVVEEHGARSCPPLVLGVGVGGSFDSAPELAKKALLRPLNEENPDLETARMEEELVEAVNELGIGPGGFGGDVTCIGARIAQAPCHVANLPVAVCVNCHALRRKTISI
ncbi:MAG: fumarate hydratase [Actinobacteria bacterium]|nr:fumarate hydratase [Actinomycetota bacterium]